MATITDLSTYMERMEYLRTQLLQVQLSTETLDRDLRILQRRSALASTDTQRVREFIEIARFGIEAAERLLERRKETRDPGQR